MTLFSLLAVVPLFGGPQVHWSAPSVFVQGQPYKVHLEVTAPKDGAVVASWLFSESAFTVDGKPLGKREEGGALNLPAGFHIEGDLDLSAYLTTSGNEFKLGYAKEVADTPPVTVKLLELAPSGLNFMDESAMPTAELEKYEVLLQTNRGDILVKFWPDIAPNHVRNFLDLAYIKFYDGTTFHRVMPGFMIQGGDPNGTGQGDGPRKLKGEFQKVKVVSLGDSKGATVKEGDVIGYEEVVKLSQMNGGLMQQGKRPIEYRAERSHLPGVLSMARSQSPDSASCQFFIMHGDAWHLDGQYSSFGEAVSGMDVVDKIANAPGRPIPGSGGNRPDQPQKIEHAVVVRVPSK